MRVALKLRLHVSLLLRKIWNDFALKIHWFNVNIFSISALYKIPKKSIGFSRKLRLSCHHYCFASIQMNRLGHILARNIWKCSFELYEVYPEGLICFKLSLWEESSIGFTYLKRLQIDYQRSPSDTSSFIASRNFTLFEVFCCLRLSLHSY